jgi:hypothetical protein
MERIAIMKQVTEKMLNLALISKSHHKEADMQHTGCEPVQ